MNHLQKDELSLAIKHIELEISILADNESVDYETINAVAKEKAHLVSALYHLKQAGY